MKPTKFIYFFALLGTTFFFAQNDFAQSVKSDYMMTEITSTLDTTNQENYFVLGAVIGSPAALSLLTGVEVKQFAFRLSGGYWQKDWYGIQGDLSFSFTKQGSFSQGVSLIGGRYKIHILNDDGTKLLKNEKYIGAAYDLYLYGFFLQLGLTSGSGDYHNPILCFQFGYLFEFK